MLQTLLAAKRYKDAKEGLLADIFYDVRRETTRPQFDEDEIAEIRGEVPLDGGLPSVRSRTYSSSNDVKIQTIPRSRY